MIHNRRAAPRVAPSLAAFVAALLLGLLPTQPAAADTTADRANGVWWICSAGKLPVAAKPTSSGWRHGVQRVMLALDSKRRANRPTQHAY